MLPAKILKRIKRQQLLQHRRRPGRAPVLSEAQILAWADHFHERTGKWPTRKSGRIVGGLGLTWHAVESALWQGLRGLKRESSLARLLAQHRGVPNRKALPRLTEKQILGWADRHNKRTGKWPKQQTGPVADAPRETWSGVNAALRLGSRGLPGGCSLARLLAEHRGVRNRGALPELTEKSVLAWAQAHRQRTGKWPGQHSGAIAEARGETWLGVSSALTTGLRGLPGGSSLARLLDQRLGVRNRSQPPPLSEEQILAWADAFRRRTANWPHKELGAFVEAPGETWSGVNKALRDGSRGLPGGGSLAQLLARRRAVPNLKALPRLTINQILTWADAHRQHTGKWPGQKTGPVDYATAETWSGVDAALRMGNRGLPGGSSLARLLTQHRNVRNPRALPRLSVKRIRGWARAFRRQHGTWPNVNSGAIRAGSQESWRALDNALRQGHRGLPGGSSLARVLGQ